MKKFLMIITALICLSCSYNYNRDIKRIEEILKIDLNQYEYTLKNKEHSVGFGEELVMFDVVFNEKDFESFLKEIDFNKFNKVDTELLEELDVKNNIDYYKNYDFEDFVTTLSLNIDKTTLYYSYFER